MRKTSTLQRYSLGRRNGEWSVSGMEWGWGWGEKWGGVEVLVYISKIWPIVLKLV